LSPSTVCRPVLMRQAQHFLPHTTNFFAMPTPHYIHFVITPADGVRMYATKFLPVTNSKGCRLKWWWTNSALEIVEPGGTRQWSYKYDSQAEELQDFLGSGFTVLRQHEALKAIEKHFEPTQVTPKKEVFYIAFKLENFVITRVSKVWDSEMQTEIQKDNTFWVNTTRADHRETIERINTANGTTY